MFLESYDLKPFFVGFVIDHKQYCWILTGYHINVLYGCPSAIEKNVVLNPTIQTLLSWVVANFQTKRLIGLTYKPAEGYKG